jgi:hypothetical protein
MSVGPITSAWYEDVIYIILATQLGVVDQTEAIVLFST